jgi:hypothetical protein
MIASVRSILIAISMRDSPLNVLHIVDKLNEAFAPIMQIFFDELAGGEAPGAALTSKKRGLPPPRKGRGRRLPLWTAA